jgi:hypothetical protein
MRFRACFGAPSEVVAVVWNKIVDRGPIETGGQPKHLLWALVHLKVYSTIEIHCSIVGWPSAKSYAKWAWYFVNRIAELIDQEIKLEDRFEGLGAVVRTNCFISVDCTDCPTFEPWPWDKKMKSTKFKGPGLKYEVAVCLKTGRIVWINGPFDAGTHDLTIFRNGLMLNLFDDEAVECDKAYDGENCLKTPFMERGRRDRSMKSNARAQHEIVNGRLKQFNVLTNHFRHMKPNKDGMKQKHRMCFHAVAVVTQLKFTVGGESIFEDGLEYDVNYF